MTGIFPKSRQWDKEIQFSSCYDSCETSPQSKPHKYEQTVESTTQNNAIIMFVFNLNLCVRYRTKVEGITKIN